MCVCVCVCVCVGGAKGMLPPPIKNYSGEGGWPSPAPLPIPTPMRISFPLFLYIQLVNEGPNDINVDFEALCFH